MATSTKPASLYDKYAVFHMEDWVSVGRGDNLTPLEGPVFVLRPDREYAAALALRYYAGYIQAENPELARDIHRMLDKIMSDKSVADVRRRSRLLAPRGFTGFDEVSCPDSHPFLYNGRCWQYGDRETWRGSGESVPVGTF